MGLKLTRALSDLAQIPVLGKPTRRFSEMGHAVMPDAGDENDVDVTA